MPNVLFKNGLEVVGCFKTLLKCDRLFTRSFFERRFLDVLNAGLVPSGVNRKFKERGHTTKA